MTLFGESAGGGVVTTLLGSPAAAGLFSAAIAQSSPATSSYDTERARRVAARFLEVLDLGTGDLDARVEALESRGGEEGGGQATAVVEPETPQDEADEAAKPDQEQVRVSLAVAGSGETTTRAMAGNPAPTVMVLEAWGVPESVPSLGVTRA